MESLRQETIEDVKTLSQLNRLKVTLVVGLVAVAFGIGPYSKIGQYSYLLLCWVPIVCVYIDFQYFHYLAKIFVRGVFLRNMEPKTDDDLTHVSYQNFMHSVRTEMAPALFGFEKKALLGSSIILSISPLLALPVFYFSRSKYETYELTILIIALITSSLCGILLTLTSYDKYRAELDKVECYEFSESITNSHLQSSGKE